MMDRREGQRKIRQVDSPARSLPVGWEVGCIAPVMHPVPDRLSAVGDRPDHFLSRLSGLQLAGRPEPDHFDGGRLPLLPPGANPYGF